MELKTLELDDLYDVADWRNQQMEILRTSHQTTHEQQSKFYKDMVVNRNVNARYWGLVEKYDNGHVEVVHHSPSLHSDNLLIGMCGVEHIQWENRIGEISLIFNPDKEIAVDEFTCALKLILEQGFLQLNLENLYTEVYECNPYYDMWLLIHRKLSMQKYIKLPSRKYWKGKYYDSAYLNFNKGDFLEHENIIP